MQTLICVWGVAVGVVWHVGWGKGSAHLSMFWTLDFLFCPFVFVTLAGLLAYGDSLYANSRLSLLRLASFVGFVVFFAVALLLLTAFALAGQ